MGCESLELPINATICCVYAFHVTTFTVVSVGTILKRDAFHPFFSILLASFLLSYAISDFFANITLLMKMVKISLSEVITVLEQIQEFFYVYASPCAVVILLERMAASFFTSRYESTRPWSMITIAQTLCVLVSLVIVSTHFYAMDLRLFYMLGLQSFIILVLVILLILNRSRTKREIGNGHLSFRYQMAENINALRIIIPVVVLDALLTFVDILCEKIFSVDVVFESMKCDIRSYFTVFVISQTARVGIEASIPLVVVILHPSLRKTIASKLCGCRSQKGDMERLQLRNVLGEKINFSQSVEQHFSYLQAKWDV